MVSTVVDEKEQFLLSWDEITKSISNGGGVISMNFKGHLTDGQKQMLVPYFRQKFGMQHGDAYPRAGTSDKGGKNGSRVATEADPLVADLVRDGLTSVNDALIMVREEVPERFQRLAAAEVREGKAKKLQHNSEVAEYISMRQSELDYTIKSIHDEGCFLPQPTLESMLRRLQTKQNLILQGPPGTGKTWLAKRLAYALIGRKDDRNVRPMQFHPNLSYEDFVRGWRPQGDGSLSLVDGPFLQIVERAGTDEDNDYVMVIEEINRGNPASIFGEMLTLLEADKRSLDESLALAYPREPDERVYIPPNVYVIGTMNTADRSIAMVDLALRRRFAFFDLEPMLNDAWRGWVEEQCGIDGAFLSEIAQRINALNEDIANDRNLGRQFRIGHSFVTPAPGSDIGEPEAWFTQVVDTEIVPLLHEYWFDDPKTVADARSRLLGIS